MILKTSTNKYLELKYEFETFEILNKIISVEKLIKLEDLSNYIISIGGR